MVDEAYALAVLDPCKASLNCPCLHFIPDNQPLLCLLQRLGVEPEGVAHRVVGGRVVVAWHVHPQQLAACLWGIVAGAWAHAPKILRQDISRYLNQLQELLETMSFLVMPQQ